jgi:hypothetical protein
MAFISTFFVWVPCVEGSYCMRPIQCLASSKIWTPPPPHRPASVYLPPLVRGEDTLAGWRLERGMGGQYFGRRQTLLCSLYSTYVSTLRTYVYSSTGHNFNRTISKVSKFNSKSKKTCKSRLNINCSERKISKNIL